MNYNPTNLSSINKDRLRIADHYVGYMNNLFYEDKKGDWEIKKQLVTDSDVKLEKQRTEIHLNFRTTYPLRAGKYTFLLDAGERVMSDTPTEIFTNLKFIDAVKGRVLIGGLGLGIMPLICLRLPVNQIDIIEKNQEVIDLVDSQLNLSSHFKINIIKDDVFTFKTRKKYDTIYMDIWTDLGPDQFKEMETLESRFSKYLKDGGWVGSWRQE